MNEYTTLGTMDITEADDMNVPVNSFLRYDGEANCFEWTADNFMPRKGCIAESMYHLQAASREILMELVKKHVVPLYAAALDNLTKKGGNYYWEIAVDAANKDNN